MNSILIIASAVVIAFIFYIKLSCFKYRNSKNLSIEINYLPRYFKYLSVIFFFAGILLFIYSFNKDPVKFQTLSYLCVSLACIIMVLTKSNYEKEIIDSIRKKAFYLTMVHGLSIIITIEIIRPFIQLEKNSEFFGYYFMFFSILLIVESYILMFNYKKGIIKKD